MALDRLAVFHTWRDEAIRSTIVEAGNGYTKVRAAAPLEWEMALSQAEYHREIRRVIRELTDELHWRTPLAHAHRRADGA